MFSFVANQILFYLAIIVILFVPGYFFLRAIEAKRKLFSSLERFIFSLGFSIIIVDFLMIFIGKTRVLLSRPSLVLAILGFSVVCAGIYALRKRVPFGRPSDENIFSGEKSDAVFSFSKNQKILVIILLFLTIFIKAAFLKDSIFPTSTDLGHHMYWSKLIAETGKLPVYEESDIIEVNGAYQVSQPESIADFIIGEHLIFSAINLISGVDFISYFPSLVLFLIHIGGILGVFVLALRLFESYPFSKNAAIIVLFFMGPLYAISSSQAKFVSGGVIGNTIGNLLIPFSLYFLYRGVKEKNTTLLFLSIFSMIGLAYTHHLSAFILLFIIAFSILLFILLNIQNIIPILKGWLKLFLKPQIIVLLIGAAIVFFFVYTLSYTSSDAVDTAVGGPSKESRAGLTFTQLKMTTGEARMVFGLIGIAILLFIKKRKSYENVFVIAWSAAMLVMSLKPNWLFLDLPSNRIANYVSFPLAIAGAFTLGYVFEKLKNSENNYYLNTKIQYALYMLLATFMLASGFYDNSQSLSARNNYQQAMQTFDASAYVTKTITDSDRVIKDHNYITADSWMKLLVMDGYNYPFSRGFFKRYEDATKPREMCTLRMISEPNTANGQKCFDDLGVNFVIVNPAFDSAQFQKSKDFWQIYSGKEITIYYRKF